MAIKTSASQEVRRLIADLTASGPTPTKREAALARLTVIGTRAVRQLVDALASATTSEARAAVLSALEAIPDARATEPILASLASTDLPVRLAAAAEGCGGSGQRVALVYRPHPSQHGRPRARGAWR